MALFKKICVVTGTRAEYGQLSLLMKKIKDDALLALQIVVTGTHLSPAFGDTYKVIEKDGFIVDEKIEILEETDDGAAVARSMGRGAIGFAGAFARLKPDLIVILGDRFEMLAAAQTALVMKIPIAHIGGGDSTEGAFDEAIRHSITKMSHFHFVTNDLAATRVRQMGENPEMIFNVGAPGIDFIRGVRFLSRDEFSKSFNYDFKTRNLLVTFHPVTLDSVSSLSQFNSLLEALNDLGSETGILFTYPNSDTEGLALIAMLENFVASHKSARAVKSLGQEGYLSAVSLFDGVVGNSSSGLYEVPSLKKPTVNIGDRQKGRLLADSVISCEPIQGKIFAAIKSALALDCSNTINPYDRGGATDRIYQVLKKDWPQDLVKKPFFRLK